MTQHLDQEISAMVAGRDEQENQDNTQPPQDGIQDVYVLIVREHEAAEDTGQVVDSAPRIPTRHPPVSVQQDSFLSAYLFVCFSLLLIA